MQETNMKRSPCRSSSDRHKKLLKHKDNDLGNDIDNDNNLRGLINSSLHIINVDSIQLVTPYNGG